VSSLPHIEPSSHDSVQGREKKQGAGWGGGGEELGGGVLGQ